MRALLAVLVLAVACVHAPPLVPQEQCAADGLIISERTTSAAGGTAVATNGSTTVVVRGQTHGETLSCRRAVTFEERCELRGALASAAVKARFQTGWRNGLIVVGFAVVIVPGIILILVFDQQSSSAFDDAYRAGIEERRRCLAGG